MPLLLALTIPGVILTKHKIIGLIIFSLVVGILIGLFVFEKLSLESTKLLEARIAEMQHAENEFKASMNFYDNVIGFDYIEVLQYAEKEDFEKIEAFVVPKLSHQYKTALKFSTSKTESEHYLKQNEAFVKKVNEMSKTSELFKQIIETRENDS